MSKEYPDIKKKLLFTYVSAEDCSSDSMTQVEIGVKEGLQIVEKTESSVRGIVGMLENMKERVSEMTATVAQISVSTQEVAARNN